MKEKDKCESSNVIERDENQITEILKSTNACKIIANLPVSLHFVLNLMRIGTFIQFVYMNL